jgi:hypothetical protein
MRNIDKESKVVNKPDPTKRKNIHVVTLKKVQTFLKEQVEPIYKSEVVRLLGVNYNSLNVALEMLPVKYDKEGRIYLKKKGGKNV